MKGDFLNKLKGVTKGHKVLFVFSLFFLLSTFTVLIYTTNRRESFDSRSKASTVELPEELKVGDLNDDGQVSMEDFRLWIQYYREYKGGGSIDKKSFVSVSAGGFHTCGIADDNNTYCWGYNKYGQLGNDSEVDSNVPILVVYPSGVKSFESINAGGSHTCGIGDDGNTYCWGKNDFGQLGVGSEADSKVPVLLNYPSGVESFDSIVLGFYHTCGIGDDGNTYCWGKNDFGQLGNGSKIDSNVPALVSYPSGVKNFSQISVGLHCTCGKGDDNNTYCWGNNHFGQLGNGSKVNSSTPILVTYPSGVTSFNNISIRSSHACGKGNDGNVYCWGSNKYGQLGNGTETDSNIPVLITYPSGVKSFDYVDVGSRHSCGQGDDDNIYCWGENEYGQLGSGNITPSNTPSLIAYPSGVKSFESISIGSYHTCGVGDDTNTYCWGHNGQGRLGDGTDRNRSIPVLVLLVDQPSAYLKGDLNNDKKVSMEDFRIWLGLYRVYKEVGDIYSTGVYWNLDDSTLKDASNLLSLQSLKNDSLVSPELVLGKKGNAVNFKGEVGYRLELNNTLLGDYFNPESLTVMGYVKLSGGSCGFQENCVILSKGSSGHKGFALAVTGGKLRFWINDTELSNVAVQAFGVTTLQKDVWYHVAGTYDKSDGSLRVYLNGKLDGKGENKDGINYGAAKLWIGNANVNVDLQFNGAIDEVRFFNRALTEAEVASYVIAD